MLCISTIISIIITAFIFYKYTQYKTNQSYEIGYQRGYELGFRTAQTTPLIIRNDTGKKINQQL